MRNLSIGCLTCLLLALIVASAPAQQGPPPGPAAPPPPPIIDQIPGDALGFMMINSIGGMADNLSAFLMASEIPFGMPPDGILAFMQMTFGLGAGFNPDGGMAIVVLDPQPFGVDLDLDLPGAPMAQDSEEIAGNAETGPAQGDEEGGDSNTWPVVFFVPGDSVQGVFGGFPSVPEGDHVKLEMPMGTVFATYRDGYVLLSPRADALDAILAEAGRLTDGLPDMQRQELTGSDIAVRIDAAKAAPIVEKALTQIGEISQMIVPAPTPEDAEAQRAGFQMGQSMIRDLLEQTQSGTMTISFSPQGLQIGGLMAMDPQSQMGLALASLEPRPSPTPNRLPDLPYAVAIAGSVQYTDPVASVVDQLEQTALTLLPETMSLPEESVAQFRTIRTQLNRQLTGFQFVLGPNTEGKMSAVVALECQDSQKVMDLIRQGAQQQQAMLAELKQREDLTSQLQGLDVTYTPSATTIDAIPVDAMQVTYAVADGQAEDWQAMAQEIFGDGSIDVMLGAVGPQIVVAGINTDSSLMGTALAVADGSGPIPANEGVVKAMAFVPGDAQVVGLINLGSLVAFVENAALEGAQTPDDLPQDTTAVPLVFFVQTDGPMIRGTLVLPIETLRDLVRRWSQPPSEPYAPQSAPEGDSGF